MPIGVAPRKIVSYADLHSDFPFAISQELEGQSGQVSSFGFFGVFHAPLRGNNSFFPACCASMHIELNNSGAIPDSKDLFGLKTF